MLKFATFLLAAIFINSCSDDACVAHTGRVCAEGKVYWQDSCGNYQEMIEECRCGCKAAAPECQRCGDCTCEQVNPCCDGCLPQNGGEFCDDGNPGTRLDLCQDGACAGWEFSIEEPAQPEAPADPAPVGLQSWTCPANWIAVDHPTLEFSWCRPPPLPRLRVGTYITPLHAGEQDGDRPVCEPAVDTTYPVLGSTECRPLGDPCPAAEWPDIPPEVTGARIYVRPGSSGNGTQASPFGSIGAAVAAATPGDVVVIAAGTYPESVAIEKDLTLWGKCAGQSLVAAPGPHQEMDAAALLVTADCRVTVKNLRFSGEQIGVVVNSPSARVTLQGVWLHQATRYGLYASLGSARMEGVLIEGTRPAPDLSRGRAIGADEGAQIVLVSSTLEHNRGHGIFVIGPDTAIDLTDVTVRETQPEELGLINGRGAEILDGARAKVTRGLFDRNRDVGFFAVSEGTVVEAVDLVVSGTEGEAANQLVGHGLHAQNGARLTLSRGRIEGNRRAGVVVSGAGTTAVLDDLVVLKTRSEEKTADLGIGLVATDGGQATVNRGLVEGNRYIGVFAGQTETRLDLFDVVVSETLSRELDLSDGSGLHIDSGARVRCERGRFVSNRTTGIFIGTQGDLTLEDVTVEDTRVQESDLRFGMGMEVRGGATVQMTRGLFARNRDIGILVSDPGVTMTVHDLTVRDTLPKTDGEFGDGLFVEYESGISITRGLFERNTNNGIMITYQATADLSDITVRDTSSDQADGKNGWGLGVQVGAEVTLARGLFERNQDVGVAVTSADSRAILEDVTVLDTRGRETDLSTGIGVLVADGPQVTAKRVRVQGNHACGIHATGAAAVMNLEDAVIQDTLSLQGGRYRGFFGRGLNVQDGARVNFQRGLLERNHELGAAAFGENTELNLNGVRIVETRERECASFPADDPGNCSHAGGGAGLGAYNGAAIFFSGVELCESSLVGLQLAVQGAVTGPGLALRDNPIGVNIQSIPTGYDFFDSVRGLLMEGNQTNFDTTELPVPDLLDIGQ